MRKPTRDKWERIRAAIHYAEVNLDMAERCDRNGRPSEMREEDVRRSLEQALEALSTQTELPL